MEKLRAACTQVSADLADCRAAMKIFPRDLWYMFR
jgi:hypothetical protein